MESFVQSKTFRVLLVLILFALFVFGVSLQLEPLPQAASGTEAGQAEAMKSPGVSPAAPSVLFPAEIRDQPSLIHGF